MQDFGPLVMLLLLVPSDHEVMSSRAVANSCLVHDNKAFTIIEHFLATFLRLDTDDVVIARRASEVILFNHLIACENLFGCFGCVEGQQRVA